MGKVLKLREHTISRPVSYRFVFDEGDSWNGWAILTINEDTGEVHLQSDYGNYQHRWTPAHTPEKAHATPMHAFFANASTGYLVDKFGYGGQPDLKSVFDEERTKQEVRALIIESRRGRGFSNAIGKHEARELWEQLGSWCDADGDLHACATELWKFLGGEPWGYVYSKPSARHDFLTETLIPFLQTWVRENVLEKATVANG